LTSARVTAPKGKRLTNQRNSERRHLLYWIPAILVAVLIALFSTHYFSNQQTGRVIIPMLHWLFPAATPRTLHLVHVGIRKMAHVTEFGLFSITVFHGIRGGRAGWRLSWALATLVIAVTYAGLDEWHQSFVPLREARVRDVALDAIGAGLAQTLVWFYAKWRSNLVVPTEFSADAAEQ
jgi:VanZ family protein